MRFAELLLFLLTQERNEIKLEVCVLKQEQNRIQAIAAATLILLLYISCVRWCERRYDNAIDEDAVYDNGTLYDWYKIILFFF